MVGAPSGTRTSAPHPNPLLADARRGLGWRTPDSHPTPEEHVDASPTRQDAVQRSCGPVGGRAPGRAPRGDGMKRVVTTARAAAMYNPVSQATLAPNGMLYTAGMIGRSPETGEMLPTFDEQAHQALRNLDALVREAGGTLGDVMFVQLYLVDMARIDAFNAIFRDYFPTDPPARAVCQPQKLFPGAQVMFTAVACVARD